MVNSLISVSCQANLNALISATTLGFLSRKKPMSIEVPSSEVRCVTEKLEDKGIVHQIWSIGPTGRLTFQRAIDIRPKSHQSRDPIKYGAFGESKSIQHWLQDPRCVISESAIRRRLVAGWDFTDAITNVDRRCDPPIARIAPPRSIPTYEAFGETHTLSEWARNKLCLVARTTLRNRVGVGWTMEKALRTPYQVPKIRPPSRRSELNSIKYEAFGELKSIKDWILDSRCLVSASNVRRRVKVGGDFTDAITKLKPSRYSEINSIKYGAFGESKSIQHWLQDPRCLVLGPTIRRRLVAGWDFTDAITKRSTIKYAAFGESKYIKDWILDSRCLVSEGTIRRRVKAGWDFTDAITKLKPSRLLEQRNHIKYEAFGESKSIKDWTKDPRCLVSASNVRRRVKAGWDFTDAITKPNSSRRSGLNPIKYEAFGESKSIEDWTKDTLCLASERTIQSRVGVGWDFTYAITKPNPSVYSVLNPIKYAAFGESKYMKDWTKDPRCLVSASNVRRRVKAGWSMEKALRTPYQVPKIKAVESIRG